VTIPNDSELDEVAQARELAERALRSLAEAQELRSTSYSARSRLMVAHRLAEQLRNGQLDIWDNLRQGVESLARVERASGRAPERMVVLLKELIDRAGIDSALRREIEADVIRWGIDAFYAA
jgi:hypothetical protein